MKNYIPDILLVFGTVILSSGIGMLAIPAGIITFGALVLIAGLKMAGK